MSNDVKTEQYRALGSIEFSKKLLNEAIPSTHDDYRRLLEDNTVNIVSVAVPNYLHHEVVLAAAMAGTTMVFDEVDAGVGGRAAVQIGRRLARLARNRQVIVVTHLPQVAAYADIHLMVDSNGKNGASGVRRLDGDDRVAELARMLAGLGDSDSARAHARELLEAADCDRIAT